MRAQVLGALLLALVGTGAVPAKREIVTITTSCTAVATTTTTSIIATTSTTVATDHTLVTDHTTQTDHTTVYETAYVLAYDPYNQGKATPFYTVAPGLVPTPSGASTVSGPDAGGTDNSGPSGSNNSGEDVSDSHSSGSSGSNAKAGNAEGSSSTSGSASSGNTSSNESTSGTDSSSSSGSGSSSVGVGAVVSPKTSDTGDNSGSSGSITGSGSTAASGTITTDPVTGGKVVEVHVGTPSENTPTPASASEAVDQAASAAPTLLPAQPPSVDPTDVNNLKPKPDGNLSFQDPTLGGDEIEYLFAEANVTYQYPTVVLPHTSFTKTPTCASDGLLVPFFDPKAYKFVKSHWTNLPFLLVTESLHCNAADDGVHVYWLVSSLSFDDTNMVVHIVAQEIAVENAYHEVSLIWGSYMPPQKGEYNVTTPVGGETGTNSTAGTGGSGGNSTSPSTGNNTTDDTPYVSPAEQTYGENSTLACLHPPASYLGLPTAACGEDFDTLLDANLGYLDPDSSDYMSKAVPTLNSTGNARRRYVQAAAQLQAKRAQRPRFYHKYLKRSWCKPCDRIAEAIAAAARAAAERLRQAAETARRLAEEAAARIRAAAEAAARFAAEEAARIAAALKFSESFSKTINLSYGPGKQVNSVFGKGNSWLMYHDEFESKKYHVEGKIDVYCVDCGFKATTTLGGRADFGFIPPRVSRAEVAVAGALTVGAKVGVAAEVEWSKTFSKNLVTVAVPEAGIAISNIATIGVAFTLDAEAELKLAAKGQVLVGATYGMPNYRATLDLLSGSGTTSGFDPVLTKYFDAQGEISATLDLTLPAELSVGLTIPAAKFKEVIGVRFVPGLETVLAAKVTSDGALEHKDETADLTEHDDDDGGKKEQDDYCPNGVSYQITLVNKVQADIFNKMIDLAVVRHPLAQDCFAFSTTPTSTSKSTLSTVSATIKSSTVLSSLSTVSTTTKSSTAPSATSVIPSSSATPSVSPPRSSSPSSSSPASTSPPAISSSAAPSVSPSPISPSATSPPVTSPQATSPPATTPPPTTPSPTSSLAPSSSADVSSVLASSDTVTPSEPVVESSSAAQPTSDPSPSSESSSVSTTDPEPSATPTTDPTSSEAPSPAPTNNAVQIGCTQADPSQCYNGEAFNEFCAYVAWAWASIEPPCCLNDFSNAADWNVDLCCQRLAEWGSGMPTSGICTGRYRKRSLRMRDESSTNSTTSDITPFGTETNSTVPPSDITTASPVTAASNDTSPAIEPTVTNSTITSVSTNATVTDSDTSTNDTKADVSKLIDDAAHNITDPLTLQNPELNYTSILDTTGSFVLGYTSAGNIVLVEASKAGTYQFGTSDGNVLAVGQNSLPVLYRDEMTTLGVSRFRLHTENDIPASANIVTLTPSGGLYLGLDTLGNVYFPIGCTVTGLGTKVFLVEDPVAGVATLLKEELQYVVTGGPVTECFAVGLLAN